MEQLVEVVQELSLARDLPAVMAVVRRAARDLTDADGATFVLREDDSCFYAEENAIGPLWKGRRFPLGECISGWVMLHQRSTVIEDVFEDSRIPIDAYRPTFVRSLAMVPIRTRDPLGAIGNYWAQPTQPTPEQVAVLQALADVTAVALENVRVYASLERLVQERTAALESANQELYREIAARQEAEEQAQRLSVTDELTGLYNRRGFLMLAEKQFHLGRRSHVSGWLFYADADGLKKLNDRDGHHAGDRLIVNIAKALRASFRESDVIGRIGGDEFAIFALGDSDLAEQLRGRLLQSIENLNRSEGAGISVSIGVTQCSPFGGASFEQMLHLADQAMYSVKRAKKR